jgi:hypothetical protein
MPNKFIALLLVIFCFANIKIAKCISIDSNVIVVSSTSLYTFTKDKNTGKVIINERRQTKYKNTESTTIPITEFYNDQSKIVSISCKFNNKTAKDFKPIDTYYTDKDIFYSDLRLNYFPLTIPANSIIDLYVEKNTFDPLYFNTIYFSSQYPISNGEITIKIPRWMNVSLKEMNLKGYTISKTTTYDSKDDSDVITYKCSNLPATKNENFSPGQSFIYPHLLALANQENKSSSSIYFSSTQEQYNWYKNLTTALNADQDPIILEQAEAITKDKASDLDKIKAIYYWVQENIRYIAFEDGIAGFKPDGATNVFRKKYGDCKGMANLTKNLIKSLGFDARLCWLGTNHIAYNYYTPSLAVDNHMICAVVYQGKTYYLDTTETFLGFGEYAERIQGRQILIENGKDFILSNVPIGSVDMNADIKKEKLTIKDKNLVGEVNHTWKGEDKESLLTALNTNKKEKIENNLNNILSNNNQNYEIKNLRYTPLNLYDSDLSASYSLDFKNSVEVFNKAYYVNLDNDKEYENFVVDTATRNHDLWLPFKVNISKEVELTIPENYVVSSIPENLNIKNDKYMFSINYEITGTKIIYRKTIKILDTKIQKAIFSSWNNDIKKLTQNYSETLTLKPKS